MSKSFANGNGLTESGPGTSGAELDLIRAEHWWTLVNGISPR